MRPERGRGDPADSGQGLRRAVPGSREKDRPPGHRIRLGEAEHFRLGVGTRPLTSDFPKPSSVPFRPSRFASGSDPFAPHSPSSIPMHTTEMESPRRTRSGIGFAIGNRPPDVLRHHAVGVEKRAVEGDVVGHHVRPSGTVPVETRQDLRFQLPVKVRRVGRVHALGVFPGLGISPADGPAGDAFDAALDPPAVEHRKMRSRR
jgi:hypothetical protein